MSAPDRFKDGYASAERHWKARWHQANGDLQKSISEIERLHARLAAVEDTITTHAREYYDPARMIGGLILNLAVFVWFVAAMGVLLWAVTL